jgi:hypothetical protein
MSSASQPHAVFKTIIVDRSGSMSSFLGKHVEMTHRMLMDTQENAEKSGVRTRVSLTTFDHEVKYPMKLVDPMLEDMVDCTQLNKMLYPRGSTRFNDTLIEEVEKLEKAAEDYKKSLPIALRRLDPLIVRIVIAITDGQDNVSTQHTVSSSRNIMKEYRRNNGTAILMAANMDAEQIGANYGFNSDRCITVHNSDEQAIEAGFRSVMRCQREISMGIDSAPFTHLERTSSCPMHNTLDTYASDGDDDTLNSAPTLLAPPVLTRHHANPPPWGDTFATNPNEAIV